ncbi:T9SS type A sorting domain-containing protein [candidate division KSB1 bacterium]|nr:T9SS type A sorting domain-containing protein [candidate division KSB1 bacterium]
MKHSILILLISVHIVSASVAQGNPADTDSSLLDFYRQYSSFTDPGEYEHLYENLPESLPELCALIKSQTIHPYAELPRYRNIIPEERGDESANYPTVKSILEGLLSYDSRGLVKDRKIQDRLILGCRHNAILLASILKYRGIPTRVRSGHVTYLIPNFHASHTLCEVWNEHDNRWILVDPTTVMVDFSIEKFDYSYDTWLKMQNGELDLDLYGNPGYYTGFISILGKVCPDLACILGTEYTLYQYAPIMDYASENDNQLTAVQIEILNEICELMKSIDAENFSKLQDIYNNTPEIQMTRSILPVIANIENGSRIEEPAKLNNFSLSQNYPNPFNPNTKIRFSIPIAGQVTLNIYNILGETVQTLINDLLPMGGHIIEFNANDLPSGVYYYNLEAGEYRQCKKMTLLR